MSVAMIREQYNLLYQTSTTINTELANLDELTDMSFQEQPPEYEDIYRVSDGDGSAENDYAIGGFGLPQQQDSELSGLTYDVQGRWFPQTYVFVDFNLGYIVSHNLVADDKWNIAGNRAKWFGRSFRRLPEVLGARLFNLGFTSNTPGPFGNLGLISPDGVPLFSTAHPNPGPGGGVQSNTNASGGAALSHASVQAMMIRMALRTDDRGMPVNIPMRTLLVPPQLWPTSLEILNSAFRTDTLNRVKNVLPNVMAVEPKQNFYLSSPTAYFGIGPKSDIGLRFIWRERFTRRIWDDNETRAVHVGGWVRLDYGYSHYFGTD